MNRRWDLKTRREFLRTASAATLGALAAGYPRRLLADDGAERLRPTADTLIVLWMAGGMAHTETFDPKRYTPFETGMSSSQLGSTFPTIDTAADPIKFTAGLEKIAAVMDRGSLIRSYTAGDPGFILHSRHQYHWHTGYAPPQTVAAPHLGAWKRRGVEGSPVPCGPRRADQTARGSRLSSVRSCGSATLQALRRRLLPGHRKPKGPKRSTIRAAGQRPRIGRGATRSANPADSSCSIGLP